MRASGVMRASAVTPITALLGYLGACSCSMLFCIRKVHAGVVADHKPQSGGPIRCGRSWPSAVHCCKYPAVP